jgi:hypothetical protein
MIYESFLLDLAQTKSVGSANLYSMGSLQNLSSTFANNYARRHCVPRRHMRQDGGVRNTETFYPVHLELAIHDRHGVASHLRRGALVPERHETIANEALQSRLIEVSWGNLALYVGPKSRGVPNLAGSFYPKDHIFHVTRIGEVVRLYLQRSVAFGPVR